MKLAKRTRRGVVAWLAIFAMLCQSLMPTLAQAYAGRASSPLVLQLCTAGGFKQISLDGASPTSSPAKTFYTPHCPYCSSGHHFALPPVPIAIVADAQYVSTAFVPAVSTPRVKSRKLAAAPPRGPPARS
ncbi:DUF2946 family protein [Burkholderia alba]|uniref:DUF2946 family protein n=1 Tax=Burkholderia alba TaxID=2683677 RepID=UPI002B0572BB|nr:DUF2946 family protein [Burkholderia alba]